MKRETQSTVSKPKSLKLHVTGKIRIHGNNHLWDSDSSSEDCSSTGSSLSMTESVCATCSATGAASLADDGS